jgi:exodeoxyribonuclease V alpha subunit
MIDSHPQLFSPENTISGTVERVTFQSPESGFCVLRIRVEGLQALVTVVGTAPDIKAGQWIDASGQWIQDPKFGNQLRADQLRISKPAGIDGMRKYLASGLVPGIGPGFAERLIEAFGQDVFDVIDNHPERLLEVEGIGRQRQSRILASWAEQKTVREVMVFLQGHGVSTGLAYRIFKKYGTGSIQRVEKDPYCLARDLRGVGFLSADRIAGNLGISGADPSRVSAGTEHVMQEIAKEGHTAYPRDELQGRVVELLAVEADTVVRAIDEGLSSGRLLSVEGTTMVALRARHRAEKELAADFLGLAASARDHQVNDLEECLARVEKETGLTLAESQRKAVRLALSCRLLVITGGPGVGKTTLLDSILKIHTTDGKKVVACAPTGRAAKRLAESTGLEARTIHRLLDFNPGTGRFRHDRENPLAGDVFVVDEFSMVDAMLAWQFVRALPPNASLLLVGDVDQLPSVGPGRVLGDTIDSGRVPVARLNEVFRQAAQSAIVTNAHRINSGMVPLDGRRGPGAGLEDFYFIEREDPEVIADLVVDLVARRLPSRLNLNPIEDIQVLTPMKRGVLGTGNLNHRLQEALNPEGKSFNRQGVLWREGDKVMQTVNNYDKDVFNGDIGVVEKVDRDEPQLLVRFAQQRVSYDPGDIDELMHSFAVSIHKSQGSEFPVVVLPLHTQHYMLLQKNLLYTGVTRGRRLVVLVGSRRAVQVAVGRTDSNRRMTMLQEFLMSDGPI